MRKTLANELGQYREDSRKNMFIRIGFDYSGQHDTAGSAVAIFPTILAYPLIITTRISRDRQTILGTPLL